MAMESYRGSSPGPRAPSASNLADILERVLDKGVVIAGDIVVQLLDVELLTIKLRLLIASADTAKKMGIDWWEGDPFTSSAARRELEDDGRRRDELEERLERIEQALRSFAPGTNTGSER
jgi:hypothetical protein